MNDNRAAVGARLLFNEWWRLPIVRFTGKRDEAVNNISVKCAPVPDGLSPRSIDSTTLELLAAWKAEDATTDPEKLREADEVVAAFKKAMNENRASTGARLLFP